MELTSIILGPVVTEKAEMQKATARTYTLLVQKTATKIDFKNALRKLYGVDVAGVRVLRTKSKTRAIGDGRIVTKRKSAKKMLVTLTEKSSALDLTKLQTA